jgi:hypothetical protein
MLGEQLVEHLQEMRELATAIADNPMVMIAGRADADHSYAGLFGSEGQAILEGIVGSLVWPEEETPLEESR